MRHLRARPSAIRPGRSLLAVIIALLLALTLGGVRPAALHASTTGVAVVTCGKIAGAVDGITSNAIVSADIDAACGIGGTPLPPTGARSMHNLAMALGDKDGVLEIQDFDGLWWTGGITLPETCTSPSPFCTLDAFTFVDGENPVFLDLPTGLKSIENGSVDFACQADGVTLTTDNDCNNAGSPNGDGVVLFHLLNDNSPMYSTRWVNVEQANVVQFFAVNISEPDTDGDGMPDWYEQQYGCMNAAVNDGALDADSDGSPNLIEYLVASDPCVADTDDDSVLDGADNCVLTPNADQVNTDNAPLSTPGVIPQDTTIPNSDSLGDGCDGDADNDWIPDAIESTLTATSPPGFCPSASGVTNPLLADSDGDRIRDGAECALGSDPADAASTPSTAPPDGDHDGLPDAFELSIGSDPAKVDTDGDGILDGVEYKGYTTSPLIVDTDGDGCSDGREIASVNGDRMVNSSDLLLVAQSFNLPGRPVMDINKDGKVNSTDLLLVAKNYTFSPC